MLVLGAVQGVAKSIWSSFLQTLHALTAAIRNRRGSDIVALAREGSPLEGLIENLLSAAFWILVLAPVLLVPVYYLIIALK
jgi:hypothetical protein